MLKIKIPDQEREQLWDEANEVFVYKPAVKGCELTLEHSLLSVSKWESIWCKPFLKKEEKTIEEMLSYIECMTISPSNVDPEVYKRIPQSEYDRVNTYINFPSTATTFSGPKNGGGGKKGKQVTSELIYYWMTASNIPFECQKWHLNRLLTLIRICEIENDPKANKNKLSANEIRQNNDKLNEARRKAMHSKG